MESRAVVATGLVRVEKRLPPGGRADRSRGLSRADPICCGFRRAKRSVGSAPLDPFVRRLVGPAFSNLFQRWGQPGQQQGRLFPPISSVRALSIRRALVSGFFADSIQHIHSLRARGVIASHAASAFGLEVSGFRKSGGTSCTTPVAISFLVIDSETSLMAVPPLRTGTHFSRSVNPQINGS